MSKYVLNPDLRLRLDGNRYILWASLPAMKDILNFHQFLTLEEATWLFLFSKGARIEDAKKFFDYVDFALTPGMIEGLVADTNWRFPDLQDVPLLIPTNNSGYFSFKDFQTFIGKPNEVSSTWHPTRTAFPLCLVHVPIYKCHGNCDYCYAPKNKDSQYIPIKILLERIAEWNREGVSDVAISGGDIFLHPEIKSIVSAYLKTPIEIVVSSKSGYPDWFMEIAQAKDQIYMQVSLDVLAGPTAAKLYGNPQLPSIALSTIEHLEAIGKRYQIHTVVARQNLREVPELARYVMAKNPQHITNWVFSDAGRSGQNNKHYHPPKPEHYYWLRKEIDALSDDTDISFRVGFGESTEPQHKDIENFMKRALCSGNRTTLTVLPSGLVTVCEELYEHPAFLIGDLKHQTTREVWEGEDARRLFFVENPELRGGICSECPKEKQCLVDVGKCWKMIMRAYGENRLYMPQPECPLAPKGKKVCPFY